MNFLEAHKLATQFAGGPELRFLFAISGTPDKVDVFLRAHGALHGRSVVARTLPFNTLAQSLLTPAAPGETEVFVLFPWDFVPEADWRSGLGSAAVDLNALRARAQSTADQLARRAGARVLYCAAPVPPLFANPKENAELDAWLTGLAASIGARPLQASVFSLASYLSNGSPFAGTQLGALAGAVVESAMRAASTEPAKVLVTDLDGVMWRGVIGEDGLDGIHYAAEGVGFRHFVYQTFLAKLKREGALIAAVSRNDAELANGPFRTGRMTLKSDDFVVIVASYNAKSSQIKEIAKQLNLGLDSFVFVDDNPIEIEEVSSAIPEIKAVQFPHSDDALPEFFARVAALFPRAIVTAEDADRTAMYRRRLEGLVPTAAEGAVLTDFLRGLDMALVINRRTKVDFTRAVQLINKTNQFNLNGKRVTEDEVAAALASGGHLYTATLNDRTGSHGEILACLVDDKRTVRSFVMSCRVFQRRAEHAFFAWLAAQPHAPKSLEFAETARNEPIRQFLDDPAFHKNSDGLVAADADAFATAHAEDLTLFALTKPSA
ncbi:MAG TPA: HAD-IIIC family phosphatase [Gemmatimonadaceae bacterium]|nr:HAD-IIIC family phosphatase [Gemmatimonadaceae bacterium]